MTTNQGRRPTATDPLLILAMDHRGSFGKSLFQVRDDQPTPAQLADMTAAKGLIYAGLRQALPAVVVGRAGVLVDQQYGQAVIDAAAADPVVLAVPIEASGHDWFTLQWPADWLAKLRAATPSYAKVLVRDNPDFPADKRAAQLAELAEVSAVLADAGIPLLYELLVPGTDAQLAGVDADTDRYDRELRPDLVTQVLADNQQAGVRPALWKVEGLETVAAARQVAEQARSVGDADLIVLGRDAPAERLHHWLDVAGQVDAFVGFAIGRSIWEHAIGDWVTDRDDERATAAIAASYLDFATSWRRG